MGDGLYGWGLIPGRGKIFFLLHSVETGSGVNPATYPRGVRGFNREGKAVEREADH
jgi:hypothetical protein